MPTRRDPAALRAEIRRLRREVAELRAAEASYRTIVDRTNSIVLRWDPEGRILFLNDFGLKLFGYTRDEVVGHSVLGLIVPDTETPYAEARPLELRNSRTTVMTDNMSTRLIHGM